MSDPIWFWRDEKRIESYTYVDRSKGKRPQLLSYLTWDNKTRLRENCVHKIHVMLQKWLCCCCLCFTTEKRSNTNLNKRTKIQLLMGGKNKTKKQRRNGLTNYNYNVIAGQMCVWNKKKKKTRRLKQTKKQKMEKRYLKDQLYLLFCLFCCDNSAEPGGESCLRQFCKIIFCFVLFNKIVIGRYQSSNIVIWKKM